ncbi:MAG TPA: hypothetical protein VFN68_14495 [Acidimicrobiales bacterium]|nr:hypothetical protein [Acidimicrobiales bacterium]
MSDAFVPEADRLEQEAGLPTDGPEEDEPALSAERDRPLPLEASEADALDQKAEVGGDGDDDFRDPGQGGYPEVREGY